jgi:hypothetical protein
MAKRIQFTSATLAVGNTTLQAVRAVMTPAPEAMSESELADEPLDARGNLAGMLVDVTVTPYGRQLLADRPEDN